MRCGINNKRTEGRGGNCIREGGVEEEEETVGRTCQQQEQQETTHKLPARAYAEKSVTYQKYPKRA